MLRRIANIVVWTYPPQSTDERLVRHGRRALRIVGLWATFSVLMFSSICEFLLTEPGWWRELWFFVCIGASGAAMLLMLPGTLAVPWAHEVARECRQRGLLGPDADELDSLLAKTAMKMCAYAGALIVVVNVVGRSAEWRPVAAITAGLLTLWSVTNVLRGAARWAASNAT